MCSNQSPWAVNETTAYGWAAVSIQGSNEAAWCCACYELTFTGGPVSGKKMIVQATNTGGDLSNNHFDIAVCDAVFFLLSLVVGGMGVVVELGVIVCFVLAGPPFPPLFPAALIINKPVLQQMPGGGVGIFNGEQPPSFFPRYLFSLKHVRR